MKIATRYLAKEVYMTMLVTIVVLLVIFLSNQLVRFMHSAAGGMLSGSAIKVLLLLQLPILLSVLLPVSLFLGILLAYGRLYADSEMLIFNACGLNPHKLLTTTLAFSFVVMVLVGFLSLWFNPKVYKYSDHISSGVASNSLEMVKANSFSVVGDGKWIFYVDEIGSDKKTFHNVFAAQQPAKKRKGSSNLAIITGKSGYQKIDPDTGDLYIILNEGYRYVGTPGNSDYEVIKYDEYGLQLRQEDKPWYKDPSSVPTLKLWQDRGNKLSAAELQWRISLPLSALILTLLGTPLSKVKPKQGRYARLAPAILLYIIYANFLFLAKAWIKKGLLSSILGMWWVHGGMLLLALYLIGQQLGWFLSKDVKRK